GVAPDLIHLTGNTVVDALRWMAPRCRLAPLKKLLGTRLQQRLLLVTCHRRENLGEPMLAVARALRAVARAHPEAVILLPLHPNPRVRELLRPILTPQDNVVVCEPLDYDTFLTCLRHAYLVLSDSGGVQEEATALGKPVLVLRQETERQEGVRAGALRLVGTDEKLIIRECDRLLTEPTAHARMCRASDVFGDGQAAERIVRILEATLAATS
ncbi:MAG TPA: UDP-N-acetylglucosamine 2-epimerase (non-hydrolyzing), partial [Methylomirabilota bacterium]|nr:UDP-N-acetylglucosamine 2-epimerase (non-hydrolyzing) [Methylomirabilota bacterium]